MNPIKYVLISCFIALLAWAFRHRAKVGIRAGVRAVAVALTALAIVSVMQPDITQRAADLVGVTRGTDLLLYCLIVVFMMTTVGMYFRFKELERRIAQIVRANALRDSVSSPAGSRPNVPSSWPSEPAEPAIIDSAQCRSD
jgi:hypothetical protein